MGLGGSKISLETAPHKNDARVRFYFYAANALTTEERLRLITGFSERLTDALADQSLAGWHSADWTIRDGFLTVNFDQFVEEVSERSAKLEAVQEMVEIHRF